MSESKDKIPLCWSCRGIIIVFGLAVLGMWGVICYTGKPEQGLEHWITVLIFLVTIVCTAIPLYMNNRYLELENKVKKQQDEFGGKINHAIKEQQKLKEEIEKQQNDLIQKIKNLNVQTCGSTSLIYLDLCEIMCEMSKSNIKLIPFAISCAITTLEYLFKSNTEIPYTIIQKDINLIYDILTQINNVNIDKPTIKKFCNLVTNPAIKNNEELFNKCIKIIQIMKK